jgi:RHS repeat-associated protein
MFNAHGDVVRHGSTVYKYDAFGNQLNATASDGNPFRYAGEYFDRETGTYYLRNRNYNPRNGRFSSEDPIKDGLNWYTYCVNNPIFFIDPSGLVMVGLRDYAATYAGSVVSWNDKTKTATVSWDGKSFSVQSTASNNINGRLIVDDSVFIDAFGIGGLNSLVYQDPITGNVSIRYGITIRGDAANSTIPNSTMAYRDAFINGVEGHWSGTFGVYNVSTYLEEREFGATVNIGHVNLDAWFQDNSYMMAPMFLWGTSHVGSISMRTGDSRNGGLIYSADQFRWVSAHEFGHLLGVADMYTNTDYKGVESIFNGYMGQYDLQARDIQKVLDAWSSGSWQTWN